MTGMPSVMQTTSSSPASNASRMASAAPGGGTKMQLALAPVSRFTALHDGVEDGDAPVELLAAASGRHACDDLRSVLDHLLRMERPGAAGDALNDETRVLADEDAH
jgi:hypothetical protein